MANWAYPFNRIVITCGVSMFSGTNFARKWAEDEQLLRFPTPSPNPAPPDGESDTDTLSRLKEGCGTPGVLPFVAESKRVSAEYSLLHALADEQRITSAPQVVLIHTDTLGGSAASTILAALFERDFRARVERQEFAMNVDDRDQMRHNLGDFMQKIASALRGYDPNTTCLAALGGYKVMTSLGYLAGAYFGFPTLYAHEDRQIIHEIPAVPIHVPDSKLREVAPLLRRVGGSGEEVAALSSDERKQLQEYPWLFERAYDLICVNAFGLFLMQQNPRLFDVTVLVDDDVDKEYRDDVRKGVLLQQIGALSAKLAAGSVEADLRHEMVWKVAAQDDWHLYKGASNGQHRIRLIYRFDREANTLAIKKAWTDNDYDDEFRSAWTGELGQTTRWQLE